MRLGLLGGTFDPIHFGHLAVAEAVRYEMGLDKVYFIPSGQPPHKKRKVAPAEHRLAMVRLAVASNPYFEVSTVEIERPGPSYTVDTVKEFRRLFPQAEIFFILGMDALAEFLTWHRVEELLTLCHFVVATRPGYPSAVKGGRGRRVTVLPVPGVAVSSTEIRERVRAGKPIKYLLPEAVEEYIYAHGLYQ
ncbi:nicotinate (nicotinamide) nucleotide adenylyltransferase [Ammonifex degensii KC4]|uniref:Probable nicotinate-nucleotide adenylyltransferase n=1 Tax=Ammonifex degensii (strain DSM 10501 / KC4) TaxID=429009 RepID=C9RAT5_AMMDK|nr:nicotinate-nucleotide adenylyltransferase [Ammonifex degensii]ACX51362.1 nicotinate (nicotinamide) nucleotide adenylyltransferase [Ammonifex degensii KC4]